MRSVGALVPETPKKSNQSAFDNRIKSLLQLYFTLLSKVNTVTDRLHKRISAIHLVSLGFGHFGHTSSPLRRTFRRFGGSCGRFWGCALVGRGSNEQVDGLARFAVAAGLFGRRIRPGRRAAALRRVCRMLAGGNWLTTGSSGIVSLPLWIQICIRCSPQSHVWPYCRNNRRLWIRRWAKGQCQWQRKSGIWQAFS